MTAMGPSWRTVHLDGVGEVEVRRPVVRDMDAAQSGDPAWWHVCVRAGGIVLTRDQVLDLDVDIATALAAEVMRPRPTAAPPSGAPGG